MVFNFSQKTNGRICFVCFFTLHGKQIKLQVCFLGESTARQSAFQFNLTFKYNFQALEMYPEYISDTAAIIN